MSAPAPSATRTVELAAVPSGKVRSAASDAALYTLATYAAQALMFVGGLVQKGLMGPVGTGFWSLMQTFWVMLTIAPLGTMQGSTRQIPIRRGRGDFAAAGAVAATGSSFSLLAVATAGLLAAVIAVAFGDAWAPELRWGLVLLGLIAPLRVLCDCHQVIFQATKRFDAAALTVVLEALAMATVGTLAVWALGFYGMFVGLVAANLVLLIAWNRKGLTGRRRPAFRWRIERRLVGELMTFGAPILIQGHIWLLFLTVDNLIIAGLVGVRELGYYALAVSVTSYVLVLPRSIGAALFPRMTERFAQTDSVAAIQHYATDVQRLLAHVLLPAFVAVGFFGVPVLIRQALPAFEPAIPAVQILAAGSFALALMNMPTKVLVTAGYRWPLVGLMLGCLGVNAAANLVAVGALDRGIEGAAVATSASYLVTFVVLTGYALSKALSGLAIARHIGELLAVFTYVAGALWLMESLVGPGGETPAADVAAAVVKLVGFLCLCAPWLARAQLRDGSLGRLWAGGASTARRLRGVRG